MDSSPLAPNISQHPNSSIRPLNADHCGTYDALSFIMIIRQVIEAMFLLEPSLLKKIAKDFFNLKANGSEKISIPFMIISMRLQHIIKRMEWHRMIEVHVN